MSIYLKDLNNIKLTQIVPLSGAIGDGTVDETTEKLTLGDVSENIIDVIDGKLSTDYLKSNSFVSKTSLDLSPIINSTYTLNQVTSIFGYQGSINSLFDTSYTKNIFLKNISLRRRSVADNNESKTIYLRVLIQNGDSWNTILKSSNRITLNSVDLDTYFDPFEMEVVDSTTDGFIDPNATIRIVFSTTDDITNTTYVGAPLRVLMNKRGGLNSSYSIINDNYSPVIKISGIVYTDIVDFTNESINSLSTTIDNTCIKNNINDVQNISSVNINSLSVSNITLSGNSSTNIISAISAGIQSNISDNIITETKNYLSTNTVTLSSANIIDKLTLNVLSSESYTLETIEDIVSALTDVIKALGGSITTNS